MFMFGMFKEFYMFCIFQRFYAFGINKTIQYKSPGNCNWNKNRRISTFNTADKPEIEFKMFHMI
jgi:hypothetical protein